MTRPHVLLAVLAMTLGLRTINAQDAAAPQPADPLKVFEARVLETSGGAALPYRLLKPLDYDPQQKYPLVLFLHGAGERGDDNEKQLIHGGRNFAHEAMRRRHPAFVAVPQCPAEKKWVEVPWEAQAHKVPEQASETLRAVFNLVDALQKEFSIDEGRIYCVGLSMGGYGAWDLLYRKPELLAAAVPICGGGDPATVEKIKGVPIWAFHGDLDPLVPVNRSREMIKALEAAGARPIYTEYEGVTHDSWTQTFDNRLVWDWLFSQRKQSKN
jgi:predicted peptidase